LIHIIGMRGFRRWLVSGVLVLLVASLDEWRQLSVPGRMGRVLDVLADFAGFFLFAAVSGFYRLAAGAKRKGA